MDEISEQGVKSEKAWDLRALKKSARDKKIAGVCGGFGEYTPIPSWLWRVMFVSSLFLGGIGLIVYIILWICMPSAETTDQ
ncbi:MAG: PspC domain-containing protein [Deltaproteobacteria bacterium]|nr:PspC domain-containing protein [Deltaproteobacteria bacterium]